MKIYNRQNPTNKSRTYNFQRILKINPVFIDNVTLFISIGEFSIQMLSNSWHNESESKYTKNKKYLSKLYDQTWYQIINDSIQVKEECISGINKY